MRKIAHISDLHFGTEDKTVAEGLIKSINNLIPDIVVISGDLTQRARNSQYKSAAAFIERLKYPSMVIPGNHDIPLFDIFSRFVLPLKRFKKYINKELNPFYADEEMIILGLNTARSLTWKNGRISSVQMNEVEKKICGVDNVMIKVIVTHHPFIPPPGEPGIDLVGRSKKALNIIDKCGADLLLAGHIHHGYSGDIRPFYPSRKRSILAVQAGTAISKRLRYEPNAFNFICIEETTIIISIYQWTGAGFDEKLHTVYTKINEEWIRDE
jgi:3',5'-cyclic AMP phosphodiesterase CpdA